MSFNQNYTYRDRGLSVAKPVG